MTKTPSGEVGVPEIGAVARWLIARGLFVFAVDHPALPRCVGAHRPDQPCDGSRGKHPVGRWARQATNDARRIAAELAHGPRNLGIACKPSGLLVVDEDRPGVFTAFAEQVGEQVPTTFTVATGKGCHYYFRQPQGMPPLGNGVGALAGLGIDVRGAAGQGGYVVAPGSIHHTGVLYTPMDSAAPFLPAPLWLVQALQARPDRPTSGAGAVAPRPAVAGGRPFKVLCALVDTVLAATAGTDRNNRLYWAACRMFEHADRGMFDAQAGRAALKQAALQVGLADGETDATLDSARAMTTRCGNSR